MCVSLNIILRLVLYRITGAPILVESVCKGVNELCPKYRKSVTAILLFEMSQSECMVGPNENDELIDWVLNPGTGVKRVRIDTGCCEILGVVRNSFNWMLLFGNRDGLGC